MKPVDTSTSKMPPLRGRTDPVTRRHTAATLLWQEPVESKENLLRSPHKAATGRQGRAPPSTKGGSILMASVDRKCDNGGGGVGCGVQLGRVSSAQVMLGLGNGEPGKRKIGEKKKRVLPTKELRKNYVKLRKSALSGAPVLRFLTLKVGGKLHLRKCAVFQQP